MNERQPRSPSLMIVDDEEGLRESISEILKLEGFNTRTAANGKEALELLHRKELSPCLILLDMMMPVMNGRDFLKEISQDPQLRSIPVLIVSAFENPNTLGAIGILKKPLDMDLLISIVSKYCQKV